MAVQSEKSSERYVGNNSTVTPYPVPFRWDDNNDLKAEALDENGVVTPITLTNHTGTGSDHGGSVRTAVAVPATSMLTIYREVPLTQMTSYLEGGRFPSASHERAVDKLTMAAQQIARSQLASIRFREADGGAARLAKVVNTLMGISAGGNPVCRTADEVKSWLSLAAPILNYPTKTWADDAERALAVPDFEGQLGTQRDTNGMYVSNSTATGDWISLQSGLPDGYLSADAPGRAKMADAYITLAKIAAGIFTADATGRGKFASGFVDGSLLSDPLDLSGRTLTIAQDQWIDNAPAGSVIQFVSVKYSDQTTISANIPLDNTIPQQTEGTEILSVSITPQRANSLLLVRFAGFGGSANNSTTAALFRDSGLDAINVTSTTYYAQQMVLEHVENAVSVAATTFKVRAGANSSTAKINGYGPTLLFGGAASATLTVSEIKQ